MVVGLVRTAWSGTSGGPGVQQFAIYDGNNAFWSTIQAQNAVNHVRTFWNAVSGVLPNDITLTVQNVVDLYSESDGKLVSSIVAPTAPTTVVGANAGSFTMAAGLKMNLQTGQVRNGRRVRGSVYIVPAAAVVYTDSGMVQSGTRTTVNAAGNALISNLATGSLTLGVWSRPKKGAEPRAGALTAVLAVDTNEKSCILRGRRD